MLHPHIELRFIDEHIGYGTFATKLIPAGTITWALDDLDQSFAPGEVARMPAYAREILDKYTFVDGRGNHVLCWDHGRYVNHSCRPTCLSPGWDFEVAVRDILPGEELTDDYGTLNVEENFSCRCGFTECRGVVRPDDPERLGDEWDKRVRAVFPLIARLEQPLWHLVKDKAEVEAAIAGRIEVPSCRRNYARGGHREVMRMAAGVGR